MGKSTSSLGFLILFFTLGSILIFGLSFNQPQQLMQDLIQLHLIKVERFHQLVHL